MAKSEEEKRKEELYKLSPEYIVDLKSKFKSGAPMLENEIKSIDHDNYIKSRKFSNDNLRASIDAMSPMGKIKGYDYEDGYKSPEKTPTNPLGWETDYRKILRRDSERAISSQEETQPLPTPGKAPRSALDRFFDVLQATGYASQGYIGAYIDNAKKDLDSISKGNFGDIDYLNFITRAKEAEGAWNGLKAGNPFGDGHEEYEYHFSDNLGKLGWNPTSKLGKGAKFVAGLAGDILLDPSTYINPISIGGNAIFKGTGTKVGSETVGKFTKEMAEAVLTKEAGGAIPKIEDTLDLVRRMNKARGIKEVVGTGKGFGIYGEDIPFNDILKLGGKKLEFVSEAKLRAFGDSTFAPFVNKVGDKLLHSKVVKAFSTKADLLDMARRDPEGLSMMFKFARNAGEANYTLKEAMENLADKFKEFKGLDKESQVAISNLIEDKKLWKEITTYKPLLDFKEGSDLNSVMEQFVRENGMDDAKLKGIIDEITPKFGVNEKATLRIKGVGDTELVIEKAVVDSHGNRFYKPYQYDKYIPEKSFVTKDILESEARTAYRKAQTDSILKQKASMDAGDSGRLNLSNDSIGVDTKGVPLSKELDDMIASGEIPITHNKVDGSFKNVKFDKPIEEMSLTDIRLVKKRLEARIQNANIARETAQVPSQIDDIVKSLKEDMDFADRLLESRKKPKSTSGTKSANMDGSAYSRDINPKTKPGLDATMDEHVPYIDKPEMARTRIEEEWLRENTPKGEFNLKTEFDAKSERVVTKETRVYTQDELNLAKTKIDSYSKEYAISSKKVQSIDAKLSELEKKSYKDTEFVKGNYKEVDALKAERKLEITKQQEINHKTSQYADIKNETVSSTPRHDKAVESIMRGEEPLYKADGSINSESKRFHKDANGKVLSVDGATFKNGKWVENPKLGIVSQSSMKWEHVKDRQTFKRFITDKIRISDDGLVRQNGKRVVGEARNMKAPKTELNPEGVVSLANITGIKGLNKNAWNKVVGDEALERSFFERLLAEEPAVKEMFEGLVNSGEISLKIGNIRSFMESYYGKPYYSPADMIHVFHKNHDTITEMLEGQFGKYKNIKSATGKAKELNEINSFRKKNALPKIEWDGEGIKPDFSDIEIKRMARQYELMNDPEAVLHFEDMKRKQFGRDAYKGIGTEDSSGVIASYKRGEAETAFDKVSNSEYINADVNKQAIEAESGIKYSAFKKTDVKKADGKFKYEFRATVEDAGDGINVWYKTPDGDIVKVSKQNLKDKGYFLAESKPTNTVTGTTVKGREFNPEAIPNSIGKAERETNKMLNSGVEYGLNSDIKAGRLEAEYQERLVADIFKDSDDTITKTLNNSGVKSSVEETPMTFTKIKGSGKDTPNIATPSIKSNEGIIKIGDTYIDASKYTKAEIKELKAQAKFKNKPISISDIESTKSVNMDKVVTKLEKSIEEHLQNPNTFLHYTNSDNIDSILKDGFDTSRKPIFSVNSKDHKYGKDVIYSTKDTKHWAQTSEMVNGKRVKKDLSPIAITLKSDSKKLTIDSMESYKKLYNDLPPRQTAEFITADKNNDWQTMSRLSREYEKSIGMPDVEPDFVEFLIAQAKHDGYDIVEIKRGSGWLSPTGKMTKYGEKDFYRQFTGNSGDYDTFILNKNAIESTEKVKGYIGTQSKIEAEKVIPKSETVINNKPVKSDIEQLKDMKDELMRRYQSLGEDGSLGSRVRQMVKIEEFEKAMKTKAEKVISKSETVINDKVIKEVATDLEESVIKAPKGLDRETVEKAINKFPNKIEKYLTDANAKPDELKSILDNLTKYKQALSSEADFETYAKSIWSDVKYKDLLEKRRVSTFGVDKTDLYDEDIVRVARGIRAEFKSVADMEQAIGKLDSRILEGYLTHVINPSYVSPLAKLTPEELDDMGIKIPSNAFNKNRTYKVGTVMPNGQILKEATIKEINDAHKDFAIQLNKKLTAMGRNPVEVQNLFLDEISDIYVKRMESHYKLMYDNAVFSDITKKFGTRYGGKKVETEFVDGIDAFLRSDADEVVESVSKQVISGKEIHEEAMAINLKNNGTMEDLENVVLNVKAKYNDATKYTKSVDPTSKVTTYSPIDVTSKPTIKPTDAIKSEKGKPLSTNSTTLKDGHKLVVSTSDLKKQLYKLSPEERAERMLAYGLKDQDLDKLGNSFIRVEKEFADKMNTDGIANIHQISEIVLDKAEKLAHIQMAKDTHGFLGAYDKFLRTYKLSVTAYRPAFHVNNIKGNTFNNYLDVGVKATSPRLQVAGVNILKKKEGSIASSYYKRDISYEEILRELTIQGKIGSGFFGRDVKAVVEKQLLDAQNSNVLKNAFELPQRVGSSIEDHAKVVNFIANLELGKSFSEAGEHVDKFLFDYGDVTKFEHDVMQRIIPFYTWMRKNTPLQLEQMINNPKRYAPFAKAIGEIENTLDDNKRIDKSKVPAFARDWVQLPFNITNEAGNEEALMWSNTMPYLDVNNIPDIFNMKDSLTNLFEKTSPAIRMPIELATNQNYFFGSKIDEGKKVTDPSGKFEISPKLNYLLTQIPQYAEPAGFVRKKGIDKLIHLFDKGLGSGIKSYDASDENLEDNRASLKNYDNLPINNTPNKKDKFESNALVDGFNGAISSASDYVFDKVNQGRPLKPEEYTGALRPISSVKYNELSSEEKTKYTPPTNDEHIAYSNRAVELSKEEFEKTGEVKKFIWSMFEKLNLGKRNQPSMFGNITRVIDGDTFEVTVGDKKQTVRMLLVDTPETVKEGMAVQPVGKEASDFSKSYLINKDTKIVFDGDKTDMYGRTLGYVETDDGVDFNKKMIEEGLAKEGYDTFQSTYKRKNEYEKAERVASKKKTGIWSIPNYATPGKDGYKKYETSREAETYTQLLQEKIKARNAQYK